MQNNSRREIYNKDFKWSIKIPENFENVSADEWINYKIQCKFENTLMRRSLISQKTILFSKVIN